MTLPCGVRETCRTPGQALVEFALVVPAIVLLVVAFLEIGRAVFAFNAISNAASQGARVAVVNQIATTSDCDQSRPIENPLDAHWSIRACAIAAAAPLRLGAADVGISYSAPPDTSLSCYPVLHIGCIASVTVTYEFTLATPFAGSVVGPMTLTATSHMPIERVFP